MADKFVLHLGNVAVAGAHTYHATKGAVPNMTKKRRNPVRQRRHPSELTASRDHQHAARAAQDPDVNEFVVSVTR